MLIQDFVECVENFPLIRFFWPFFWFFDKDLFATVTAKMVFFWFVFMSYWKILIKFKTTNRICNVHGLLELESYFYLSKQWELINHKYVLYGKKWIQCMKKLLGTCHNCGKEELFMTEYDCLKILLKTKNWIVCKNCDYVIQIEKLKNELCCVWLRY